MLAHRDATTTTTTRRKKNRIKKKRVPFDPETHAHRQRKHTPPCIARETSTDPPKTKESETCWKVERNKEEGKDRSGEKTY